MGVCLILDHADNGEATKERARANPTDKAAKDLQKEAMVAASSQRAMANKQWKVKKAKEKEIRARPSEAPPAMTGQMSETGRVVPQNGRSNVFLQPSRHFVG